MHDCYKTNGGGNIWEIMMTSLEPGKTRIVYNTVFVGKDFIMPEDDLGYPTFIGTKHGSFESDVELEIAYNVMYSPPMPYAAISTGQYNTYAHHNIMFNKGHSLGVYDGGTGNYCFYCDIKFENNTAVNCTALLTIPPAWGGEYDPENRDLPNPTSCDSALGSLYFNNNIITNSTHETSFNFESGFMIFYTYVRDRFYEEFIMGDNLHMDNNIYYATNTDLKTNPYAVSLFSSNNNNANPLGPIDQYGATYSINQWQTDTTTKPFNYDVHSFVEDPLLKTDDGSFMPQNCNAKDKGWLADVTTEVIWDIDGDKKWSLPDIIYGLEVLAGKRK